MELPLEAVPNFSEGRDAAVVKAIGRALAKRAELLDVHVDVDHNRSVFTLVGERARARRRALRRRSRARVKRIDLRGHGGVHPRIGAADVVPIVPIRPEDAPRAAAAALEARAAHRRGARAAGLSLRRRRRRPRARRSSAAAGPRSCSAASTRASSRPTSGRRGSIRRRAASIVGARRPLIAFNVNLAGANVEVAREIARVVRERDGGFPGVRALGLDLPSTGQAQVSMNVEDWEASALHEIVAAIEREAAARGVEVAGSELVGLDAGGAAAAAAGAVLRIDGFDASRLLELRLLGD